MITYLAQGVEALPDAAVGEDVVPVVDGDPAETPTWDEIALGKPTAAQDGHSLGETGDRNVRLLGSVEDKVLVDFVGDNREAMAFGNVEDVAKVVLVEDRAARVGRVVDEDGGGALVNQGLHVLEVDLPLAFRNQVILLRLDAEAVGKGGVERESRTGNQYVVSGIGEGRDAEVERARAAGAEDHVVRREVISVDVLGNGLPGLDVAGRGCVAIKIPVCDLKNDQIVFS